MQAIIKIGSSQYTVEPGQELLADRGQIDAVLFPEGAKVTIKDLEKLKVRRFAQPNTKPKAVIVKSVLSLFITK